MRSLKAYLRDTLKYSRDYILNEILVRLKTDSQDCEVKIFLRARLSFSYRSGFAAREA
jgi:hypothetical protein